jgi:hypothetical protein
VSRSTTGCRPASISIASDSSSVGRTQSALARDGRERLRDVELGHLRGGPAHALRLRAQTRAEGFENARLGRGGALARAQRHAFPALELVGRVALACDRRLLAPVLGRNEAEARLVTSIDQPKTRL